MIRSVTIGPLPIFFGNVNVAMGLPGHHHTAQVWLVYGHRDGEHGYPSFQATNDELRAHLSAHTGKRNTFRGATNEDVAERLFMLMAQFVPESARRYGGAWWLDVLHLDVEGVQDAIGHDNGTTRYTIALPAQGLGRWMLPGQTYEEDLTEEGRRLASQREDLIAQGVDPADLVVPIHPVVDTSHLTDPMVQGDTPPPTEGTPELGIPPTDFGDPVPYLQCAYGTRVSHRPGPGEHTRPCGAPVTDPDHEGHIRA